MGSRVRRVRRKGPGVRPWAPWTVVVPLVVAAGVGLALALDVRLTLLVCVGVVVTVVMLARLDAAVLLVVAYAVLDDHLSLVVPRAGDLLVLLLVGSWAVHRARTGPRTRRAGPVDPVLLAEGSLLVVVLASTAVHRNGSVGGGVTLGYVELVAVLAVLVDAMRGGLDARRVATVYVGACSVAAGLGIGQYVLGPDRRVGGPVGDPNDLALYLLAALPLALALRVRAARPWVLDVAVSLLLVAVLGTLSRGAILGLAVAAVVAVLTRVVSWRAVLVGGVAAVTLVAVTAGLLAGSVTSSIEGKSAVDTENVAERFELWQTATAMTLDAPLLGRGPGAFELFHQDYRRLPAEVPSRLDTAQNTYLEIAAELGLLGLLAWVVVLGAALRGAWARWRTDREPLAAGVVTALVGTGVASFFVTGQHLLPWWLLVALAVAIGRPRAVGRRPAEPARTGVLGDRTGPGGAVHGA